MYCCWFSFKLASIFVYIFQAVYIQVSWWEVRRRSQERANQHVEHALWASAVLLATNNTLTCMHTGAKIKYAHAHLWTDSHILCQLDRDKKRKLHIIASQMWIPVHVGICFIHHFFFNNDNKTTYISYISPFSLAMVISWSLTFFFHVFQSIQQSRWSEGASCPT